MKKRITGAILFGLILSGITFVNTGLPGGNLVLAAEDSDEMDVDVDIEDLDEDTDIDEVDADDADEDEDIEEIDISGTDTGSSKKTIDAKVNLGDEATEDKMDVDSDLGSGGIVKRTQVSARKASNSANTVSSKTKKSTKAKHVLDQNYKTGVDSGVDLFLLIGILMGVCALASCVIWQRNLRWRR